MAFQPVVTVPSVTTRGRNRIAIDGYDAGHKPHGRSGSNAAAAGFRYDGMDRLVVDSNAIMKRDLSFGTHGAVVRDVTTLLGVNQEYEILHYRDERGRLDSTRVLGPLSIAFTPRRYYYSAGTGAIDSLRLGNTKVGYWYDAERKLSERAFPSVSATKTSTSIHRPSDVMYSASVLQAFSRGYGYDSLGRMVEVLRDRATNGDATPRQFYYDKLGRLVSDRRLERRSCGTSPDTLAGYGFDCVPDAWGPANILYSYDSVGNRRDRMGEYSAGNRLSFFADTIGAGWQNFAPWPSPVRGPR